MVLAPKVRAQQIVERRQRPPPRDVAGHLEPLGVLVELRVNDVDEGLVPVEEAVPAGQEVALEPALTHVLGEDLHHAAVRSEVVVRGQRLGDPGAVGGLEYPVQAVRSGLVGSEQPEAVRVIANDVAQVGAQHPGRLAQRGAGRGDLHGVVTVVGQLQVTYQLASVCVRVRAHAAFPAGRQLGQLRGEPSPIVEELLGAVAVQPQLERRQVVGPLAYLFERDLVRPRRPLGWPPVHLLGPGPALGCAQHDHRPARPGRLASKRGLLDASDLLQRLIERARHLLMDELRVVSLDQPGPVAIPLQQRTQLVPSARSWRRTDRSTGERCACAPDRSTAGRTRLERRRSRRRPPERNAGTTRLARSTR